MKIGFIPHASMTTHYRNFTCSSSQNANRSRMPSEYPAGWSKPAILPAPGAPKRGSQNSSTYPRSTPAGFYSPVALLRGNVTSRVRSGAGDRLSEVLPSADRHICDEHDSGVPIEQRPQAREDRLDFLFRHHGHNHDKTFLLVEHKMRFTKSMVPFARDVANDCIAGCMHMFEQIRHKRPVFTCDNHANFLHWMQRQPIHSTDSFPLSSSEYSATPSIRVHTPVGRYRYKTPPSGSSATRCTHSL